MRAFELDSMMDACVREGGLRVEARLPEAISKRKAS